MKYEAVPVASLSVKYGYGVIWGGRIYKVTLYGGRRHGACCCAACKVSCHVIPLVFAAGEGGDLRGRDGDGFAWFVGGGLILWDLVMVWCGVFTCDGCVD